MSEEADVPNPSSKEGCAWEECLCSGGRALHSLQVFMGCKKASYCNSTCQKKD
ncbi:hypothetical protein C8Q75DRAFT_762434 [Abortiporus biennis]|nr:hypothetical protein C8Q75DRAFT_762434 [Abortiporus biennis]